jgi:ATP-dependent DNA helicase RecG
VDAELKRRVDALRRPLELAAANNFAGVRKVQGLGNVLRIACDGLMQRWTSDQLASWRATLTQWEQLPVAQQQVEVARGMRLIARLPSMPSRAGDAAANALEVPTASQVIAAAPKVVERRQPSTKVVRGMPLASSTAAVSTAAPEVARREYRPRTPTEIGIDKRVPGDNAVLADVSAAKPGRKPRGVAAATETIIDPLGAPTRSLPGIGPAFAEKLAEKGLETVEDLLWCLPRRYDDVRDAKQLADVDAMDEGMRATFVARVASSRMIFARGRRWAEVRLAELDTPERAARLAAFALPVTAVVRWFNVWAGIEKRMPAGALVTLSGVVKKRGGKLELANPDILAIDIIETADSAAGAGVAGAGAKKPMPTIIARYPDVVGVPASRLRVACQTACDRVGATADDGVPASIERAANMPSLPETLARLHRPAADISVDDLAALNRGDSPWQRRLAFGELFSLGVAVAIRRRERRHDIAVACERTAGLDDDVAKALPFRLTKAQARSIREMGDDLSRATPMNRLLQGDVGSGKTAVAFAAALHVARAKRQVALMAPTELLAEQHAETWRAWAEATGLRVELLTASTQRGVRQSMLALLAAGHIEVLIGTHSLLAEGVGFSALGLVIIDEQHRFGVAQRAKLRDKGDGQGAPHLLVMTATPIPRTLALTAYGDLDVSVLDELPPGREAARTQVFAGKRGESAAWKLVSERVAAGERAYVVCPKVEDDSDSDWKDATTVAAELAEEMPKLRVGLVHGRLDSEKRDRVMRAFKDGALDVLVATTVIEVGVDVPAATVMVVLDAERFGLAQLHQLRGRVGRGGGAAHCLLVTGGSISEDGRRRLDAMASTNDGFRIAEEDLALRGPGELLGPRQAGVPRLRFGSLAQHTELSLEARGHAERILDEDPHLVRPEHASLKRALVRRFAQSVYGAESG